MMDGVLMVLQIKLKCVRVLYIAGIFNLYYFTARSSAVTTGVVEFSRQRMC